MKLKKKIPKNEVPFREVYSALNYCKSKEKGVGRVSEVTSNMYVAMSHIFFYKVANPLVTEDFVEMHEMYSIPKQKVYSIVEEIREKALKEKEPLRLKDLSFERNVTYSNHKVCTIESYLQVSEKLMRVICKTFQEDSFVWLPPENDIKQGIYIYEEGKEMFLLPFENTVSSNKFKKEEKEDVEEERSKPKLKLKRK